MTVATSVISKVYPVIGGAGALLATRGALAAVKQVIVGDAQSSRTPPDREGGGAAWVWTALSWAVSVGVGLYTGSKLVRPASPVRTGAVQPAQSKQ